MDEHKHRYDEMGRQLCCTQSQKIYDKAGASELVGSKNRKEKGDCCTHDVEADSHDEDHDHSHDLGTGNYLRLFIPAIMSLVLLLVALGIDNYYPKEWFKGWVRVLWYLVAYVPVGLPVLKDAVVSIFRGNFFSEFFLMGIATLGAFAISEYPEGVAVMLFYAVGESFQTLAVSRAKSNIKSLLDQRPDQATVMRNGVALQIKAKDVRINDVIQLKAGEKLGLDGILMNEKAVFNTAALTGESKPDTKYEGEVVLAGMINLDTLVNVLVTTAYADSKLSRILEMVQNASNKKAPTELFISRFAKIYTPIVVFLAVAIALLPALFVTDYQFTVWLYRALVFLVISCPCALVISIPLGYFGGIGAASRNGILIKGSNFLDVLSDIQNVVMDKTGTMTEGVFEVQKLELADGFDRKEILAMVNSLESKSSHPVATAIHNYVGDLDHSLVLEEVEEIAGHGLKASVKGRELLVGNFRLMDKFSIDYDIDPASIVFTVIAIAYGGQFAGYITISDRIKDDALKTIRQLHRSGVKATMLSGDKSSVVQYVAKELGIDHAFGDLLPEDKVKRVEEIKSKGESVAFVGDGVNDAPVVALSDVGIAMGGLGSDATIETADVVIQDDRPSKIPIAIRIGKKTKRIVWQNIVLAFVVKAIVLVLGAGGLATMWEAVFADVGVALLAILNAVRIQRFNFE
ncbi:MULTISPECIES: heavy metal translocating P-type ATPase [Sphingobacterium]|uniref:heavy metal translocating P-type ATPase n=1 Tax=Sphingobacterium TaxID=28453 RepID=UPI0013D9B050|nr:MULTISPECIES: heavy metal translocating P-type ATPase [unclassified Sphingobacterium]